MNIKKIISEETQSYLFKEINLEQKYDKVLFSDSFYEKNERTINHSKKLYLEKIDRFINFYNKYQPKGVRITNGRDTYEASKDVFDKIVRGEVYIDHIFGNPDNPLRNVVMLLHIDEPVLKRRMGIN